MFSIVVKNHHDQGNSYTVKWGWLTGSEVYSVIIMVGSMMTDMVLEKALHLDLQAAERASHPVRVELQSLRPVTHFLR